jgi:hypothetical protein
MSLEKPKKASVIRSAMRTLTRIEHLAEMPFEEGSSAIQLSDNIESGLVSSQTKGNFFHKSRSTWVYVFIAVFVVFALIATVYHFNGLHTEIRQTGDHNVVNHDGTVVIRVSPEHDDKKKDPTSKPDKQ